MYAASRINRPRCSCWPYHQRRMQMRCVLNLRHADSMKIGLIGIAPMPQPRAPSISDGSDNSSEARVPVSPVQLWRTGRTCNPNNDDGWVVRLDITVRPARVLTTTTVIGALLLPARHIGSNCDGGTLVALPRAACLGVCSRQDTQPPSLSACRSVGKRDSAFGFIYCRYEVCEYNLSTVG